MCNGKPGCENALWTDSHRKTWPVCQSCFRKGYRGGNSGLDVPILNQRIKALTTDLRVSRKETEAALARVDQLEHEASAFYALDQQLEPTPIVAKHGSGTSEGTVVTFASDWHMEEIVTKKVTNGMNTYNPKIAKARATRYFQAVHRLTQLLQQDIKVENMVLGLGGDFMTGHIHPELVETTAMPPMQAILFAEETIIGGIDFLLNALPGVRFTVPCKVGNHSRTTFKTQQTTEAGHALETVMYRHLARHYSSAADRISFQIEDGYHSYIKVYNKTLRFHHGHEIKYLGGVGGIFISAFKAIAKWNEIRKASLDVFGHHHQLHDGRLFRSNGSMIGFNAYALRNKFGYEEPKQDFFLIDKKRGRTCDWPIWFGE